MPAQPIVESIQSVGGAFMITAKPSSDQTLYAAGREMKHEPRFLLSDSQILMHFINDKIQKIFKR